MGNGGQRERGSTSSIQHHATKSRLEPGEIKKTVEALKKSQMWNSEGENNNIFAGGDQGEE